MGNGRPDPRRVSPDSVMLNVRSIFDAFDKPNVPVHDILLLAQQSIAGSRPVVLEIAISQEFVERAQQPLGFSGQVTLGEMESMFELL